MKRGDYAHIPGTGPSYARCADCDRLTGLNNNKGRCLKAAEMRRVPVNKLDLITAGTPACKYFVAKG